MDPELIGPILNDNVANGNFTLTAADLEGLLNLVRGLPAVPGTDDTLNSTGIRTLSGFGNNIDNPGYGAADQPFIRLTDARYGDYSAGIGNFDVNPIFDGLDPRAISNTLGDQEANLGTNSKNANSLFTGFGQYFDHGLTFIPKNPENGTIAIGGPGMERGPFSDNPADLTRGEIAVLGIDGLPVHINKTSPFVDQNQAYGSHELVGQFLRESDGAQGFGMLLLNGEPDPSDPTFTLLPTLRDLIEHHWEANTIFRDPSLPGGAQAFRDAFPGLVDAGTGAINGAQVAAMANNFMGSGHALLLDTNPFMNLLDHRIAGDGRANENIGLTAIHTIWARNHNFHVENLVAQGFDGTADEVFQAAKLLNISDYQRAIFTDFADMLLGGMRGAGDHGRNGYNDQADASISHEFAAAAYRFGHSLIGETLQIIGPDGQPFEVSLFDAFLNPTNAPEAFTAPLPAGYVPQPGYTEHGAAAIIAGNASQVAEEVDFNIVDAVRNDLVRINADLFAFNVARGWDVGLGTLNQIRADLAASTNPYISETVGFAGDLSPYTDWADFQARNGLSDTVIAQFQEAYPDLVLSTQEDIDAFVAVNPDIALTDGPGGSKIVSGIDRVDMWVGGLAESHVLGGMVGQTFWVVIHEQLDRLQEGDRFYYLEQFDNFDFYQAFGEKANFANIVARNSSLNGFDSTIFDVTNINLPMAASDIAWGAVEPDQWGLPGIGDVIAQLSHTGGLEGSTYKLISGTSAGFSLSSTGELAKSGNDFTPNSTYTIVVKVTGPDGGAYEKSFNVVTGDRGGQDFTVLATSGDDVFYGHRGSDTLMQGGAGDDVMFGQAGRDVMDGGADNDQLYGGRHTDNLTGGSGDDQLFGGTYDDVLYGGTGNDMLDGGGSRDELYGGIGNDVLTGGGSHDQLYGGEGDDTFVASIGDRADIYVGDDGTGNVGVDTLDMSAITANIMVDFRAGFTQSSQTWRDTITEIENVVTGSGDDTIVANEVVNVMDGGDGNDIFRFQTSDDANGDTIMNFVAGDMIDLSFIDANGAAAGDGAFTLGTGGLTGAGQLSVSYEARDDGTYAVIEGSTTSAAADFTLNVKTDLTLTTSDFGL